ncbi:MAG: alpha/beta hydrolase-fold protein [Fuerstiella sp.]|nr:alpha/beta hydrolase-fold protein [Fuerstiella sp.]
MSSQWQAADTVIKVLLPDRIKPRHKYRTLYVLPVESGETTRWGDSIAEILKHNLHNSCQLICVFPTFADLPWYADHPTDVHLRQETYLMRDVVPLIEAEYLVRTDASGRLLVGFSKSGWGAWSLLLRHPDVFGRAAAFDAPLMMGAPGKYGSGPIFGTPENFVGYQISRQLKPRVSELRRSGPRLALFGKGNFQKEHQQVSQLLQKLQIPCYQEDSTVREHSWHSGWLPLAVRWLAAP